MTYRSLFFALLLPISLLGCALGSSEIGDERTLSEKDVLEFMDRWAEAEASEDFDNLLPLVHPDAVYRSSGGDHLGVKAIRQSFESTFNASPDQNYYIEDVRVTYVGSQTATVIYAWNWHGKTPDGVAFRITGRGSKVIARDEAGLRLRLLHLNQDSATAEPS